MSKRIVTSMRKTSNGWEPRHIRMTPYVRSNGKNR